MIHRRWVAVLLGLVFFAASVDFACAYSLARGHTGFVGTPIPPVTGIVPGVLAPGTCNPCTDSALHLENYFYGNPWPPQHQPAQQGSSSSPYFNSDVMMQWSGAQLDTVAATSQECLIGASPSGAISGSPTDYGIDHVNFYADGSDITGPSAPVTVTAASGDPTPYTISSITGNGTTATATLASVGFAFTAPVPSTGEGYGYHIAITGAGGFNGSYQLTGSSAADLTHANATISFASSFNGTVSGGTLNITEPQYWCVTINPALFADGLHELRATVYPRAGWPRLMQGPHFVSKSGSNTGIDETGDTGIFTVPAHGWSFSPMTIDSVGSPGATSCLSPTGGGSAAVAQNYRTAVQTNPGMPPDVRPSEPLRGYQFALFNAQQNTIVSMQGCTDDDIVFNDFRGTQNIGINQFWMPYGGQESSVLLPPLRNNHAFWFFTNSHGTAYNPTLTIDGAAGSDAPGCGQAGSPCASIDGAIDFSLPLNPDTASNTSGQNTCTLNAVLGSAVFTTPASGAGSCNFIVGQSLWSTDQSGTLARNVHIALPYWIVGDAGEAVGTTISAGGNFSLSSIPLASVTSAPPCPNAATFVCGTTNNGTITPVHAGGDGVTLVLNGTPAAPQYYNFGTQPQTNNAANYAQWFTIQGQTPTGSIINASGHSSFLTDPSFAVDKLSLTASFTTGQKETVSYPSSTPLTVGSAVEIGGLTCPVGVACGNPNGSGLVITDASPVSYVPTASSWSGTVQTVTFTPAETITVGASVAMSGLSCTACGTTPKPNGPGTVTASSPGSVTFANSSLTGSGSMALASPGMTSNTSFLTVTNPGLTSGTSGTMTPININQGNGFSFVHLKDLSICGIDPTINASPLCSPTEPNPYSDVSLGAGFTGAAGQRGGIWLDNVAAYGIGRWNSGGCVSLTPCPTTNAWVGGIWFTHGSRSWNMGTGPLNDYNPGFSTAENMLYSGDLGQFAQTGLIRNVTDDGLAQLSYSQLDCADWNAAGNPGDICTGANTITTGSNLVPVTGINSAFVSNTAGFTTSVTPFGGTFFSRFGWANVPPWFANISSSPHFASSGCPSGACTALVCFDATGVAPNCPAGPAAVAPCVTANVSCFVLAAGETVTATTIPAQLAWSTGVHVDAFFIKDAAPNAGTGSTTDVVTVNFDIPEHPCDFTQTGTSCNASEGMIAQMGVLGDWAMLTANPSQSTSPVWHPSQYMENVYLKNMNIAAGSAEQLGGINTSRSNGFFGGPLYPTGGGFYGNGRVDGIVLDNAICSPVNQLNNGVPLYYGYWAQSIQGNGTDATMIFGDGGITIPAGTTIGTQSVAPQNTTQATKNSVSNPIDTISSVTWSGTVETVTFSPAVTIPAGNLVTIAGETPANLDIASAAVLASPAPSAGVFSITNGALTGSGSDTVSGTATILGYANGGPANGFNVASTPVVGTTAGQIEFSSTVNLPIMLDNPNPGLAPSVAGFVISPTGVGSHEDALSYVNAPATDACRD